MLDDGYNCRRPVAGSSNGRTPDSGSGSWGSNPCPAARRRPASVSETAAVLRVGAAQRTRELFGADRLGEVVVHPGRKAGLAVLEHGVGGHGDDAGTGL